MEWGWLCKRQSIKTNTDTCSICPMNKKISKFKQWGVKELLLLCGAYNALVNMSRPYLPILWHHNFQGLWYLPLTSGKGARFTTFFQSVAREEGGAAPNLLLGPLGVEGEHAQSVSSLPRRTKVFSQKASKFSLGWQRDILFPAHGKWIQHVWAQEVRKKIFIMGDFGNIANKPW